MVVDCGGGGCVRPAVDPNRRSGCCWCWWWTTTEMPPRPEEVGMRSFHPRRRKNCTMVNHVSHTHSHTHTHTLSLTHTHTEHEGRPWCTSTRSHRRPTHPVSPPRSFLSRHVLQLQHRRQEKIARCKKKGLASDGAPYGAPAQRPRTGRRPARASVAAPAVTPRSHHTSSPRASRSVRRVPASRRPW